MQHHGVVRAEAQQQAARGAVVGHRGGRATGQPDGVCAFGVVHRLGNTVDQRQVVCIQHVGVVATTAVQVVHPSTTDKGVIAQTAVQRVGTITAVEAVVATAAVEVVRPSSTEKRVRVGTPIQTVVAFAPVQHVGPIAADQGVDAGPPRQGVVTGQL